MKKFFISFVIYALAELALFIIIGQSIGVFNTLLLVVATTIIGIYIAKNKGIRSVKNIKSTVARGEAPGPALVDAMLTFSGGVFLAVPGFITDVIGLLLLLPPTRKLFQPLLFYWMRKKMKKGQFIIVQK